MVELLGFYRRKATGSVFCCKRMQLGSGKARVVGHLCKTQGPDVILSMSEADFFEQFERTPVNLTPTPIVVVRAGVPRKG